MQKLSRLTAQQKIKNKPCIEQPPLYFTFAKRMTKRCFVPFYLAPQCRPVFTESLNMNIVMITTPALSRYRRNGYGQGYAFRYIVTQDSMGTLQKRLSLCRRTLIKLSRAISNLSQLLFSSLRSANANAVNDTLLQIVNGGKKVIARFEAPVTEPHHLFLRCNINQAKIEESDGP